mgnify:CR=1 FL=1
MYLVRRIKFHYFICGLLLASCTHLKIITWSDTKPAYTLTCKNDILPCLEKAIKMCPNGYDRLDKNEDSPRRKHLIIFRCKPKESSPLPDDDDQT